jgi:hypothetical protein
MVLAFGLTIGCSFGLFVSDGLADGDDDAPQQDLPATPPVMSQ